MEPAKILQMPKPEKERRKRGEGRIWLVGRIWWIQFYSRGRQVRESSHSETKAVAERLLRRRLGEVAAGLQPAPRVERVKYETLRDALIADYQTNGRKWLRTGKNGEQYICGISALDKFFKGFRVIEITTDKLREFTRKRQESGAANGTINRELALLRRMFNLAVQDQKLRDVPYFPMLKEAAPRKGFLDHADFQRLRTALPEYLRPILTAGYYTGMRLGEIMGLRWGNVSLIDAQIRLNPGETKNDDARVIPIIGELLEMLKIQREKAPGSEFVFTRVTKKSGPKIIGGFRKAWVTACTNAGLPGLLFHDLRRTGVRNLVRAGVPERVAMAISGHRTRAVFERYNIVSERDLKEAARKLDNYLTSQNGAKNGVNGDSAPEPEKNGPTITQ